MVDVCDRWWHRTIYMVVGIVYITGSTPVTTT